MRVISINCRFSLLPRSNHRRANLSNHAQQHNFRSFGHMFPQCRRQGAAAGRLEDCRPERALRGAIQSDLKRHPERATAVGDYRYNDQLDDYSPAGFQLQHALDEDFLVRLDAISTAGFPEQDRLSHEVMQRALEQRIANFKFKEYEMPVNHMEGPQTRLA